MNAVNIGVQQATIAAQAIKAKLVIPRFKNTETKPTDFNDLMVLEGLGEVRKQIASAEEVESVEDENTSKRTQSSKALELIKDLELFHDKQKVAYATIEINGHKETWRLDSADFHDWLNSQFWKKHRQAISDNTLSAVINVLQGKAKFEGVRTDVYTRVATVDEAIYINLVNDAWEVVKVTKNSWQIMKDCPVKFTRTPNMQALPMPLSDGAFEAFWQYVNIPEKYQKLVLAFILECFRINTPKPMLIFYGVEGSGKSGAQSKVRMLIDPSTDNLRSAPRKSEDLLVAAANNWMVSFNNISYLTDSQQDDLCSIATGGAFSTRTLYTTHQESVVNIRRPVMLNGIGDLIVAQDLLDRCIILELPEITDDFCKTEEEILQEFNKQYPAIFGAVLDILVALLRKLPNTKLERKPRMADFAVLGTALEKVMGWEQGSFMIDYRQNRSDSRTAAIEHSPVAIALISFISDVFTYSGNYSNLYERLAKYKSEMAGWAKSPKGLAHLIKRQKLALRAVGIEVTFDNQRHKDGYHVHIEKVGNDVHQVHQVHQSTIDKTFKSELEGEHAKPSTPQAHPKNPCQHCTGEHGELNEHKNLDLSNACATTINDKKMVNKSDSWIDTPSFNDNIDENKKSI